MTQPPRWRDDPATTESVKSALAAMSTATSLVAPTAASEQRILAGVLNSVAFVAGDNSGQKPGDENPLPEGTHHLAEPTGVTAPASNLVSALKTAAAAKWLAVVAGGGLALATLRAVQVPATTATHAGVAPASTSTLETVVPPQLTESQPTAYKLADSLVQRPMIAERPVVAERSVVSEPPTSRLHPVNSSSEVDLLLELRRALGTDPERALALCSQHRRQFHAGRFAEEREAMTVEALVLLGRKTQARTRWLAFQQSYPTSVYAERLEKLLLPTATRLQR